MKLLSLVLLVPSLFASSVLASYPNQLSEPFLSLREEVGKNPQQLTEDLKQMAPDVLVPAQQLERWLLLSEAYNVLVRPDEALKYAELGLSKCDPKSLTWHCQMLTLAQATAFELQGLPRKSLVKSESVLAWALSHQQIRLESEARVVRGLAYLTLLDYTAALEDFMRSYALAESGASGENPSSIAGLIALVYEYRGETELSIPYFQQAVEYHRDQENDVELSIALYGLGRAYVNAGRVEEGQAILIASADISRRIDDLQGVAYALKELAAINRRAEKFALAEQQLSESLAIFEKANNPYMLFDVTFSQAKLALDQHQTDLAYELTQKAKNHLQVEGMKTQRNHLKIFESSVLAAKGDVAQAYELLKKAMNEQTRLVNERSTEQLHQMRTKYELQSAQHEEALANAQLDISKNENRQLWLLMMAILVICLLLLLLFYRSSRAQKELARVASLDSLTGLNNRRVTFELIDTQMDLAKRHRHAFSVAMIDLDFFKEINDQYGHATGDKVLQEFAVICRRTCRHTDIVGRIGGEEFLLGLPHTGAEDALKLLNKIRSEFAEPSLAKRFSVARLSLSAGVVEAGSGSELAELLTAADQALYQAKNSGRNQVINATPVEDDKEK